MLIIKKFNQHKSPPSSSYIARVTNITPLKNKLQAGLALEILGNKVDAITNTASVNSVRIGGEVIVEGCWRGDHWNSVLIVNNISNYQAPLPLVKGFEKQCKQTLLKRLLGQLSPPLRTFVTSVLTSEVGTQFMSIRASKSHHHNDQKGLLMHSLEVALIAGQVAMVWLNKPEAELTIVAALFHDLGKVRTTARSAGGSGKAVFAPHESYNLELLSPYLVELETQWPLGADLLRNLLANDHTRGQFPSFPGQLIIKMADQLSTALNRRTTLFNQHPSHHYFAYDEQHQQKYLRVPC